MSSVALFLICAYHQYSDTNSMVEEFMLLANIYTAQKTMEEFPQCAVLRRHPAPPLSNYEPLVKVAEAKVGNIVGRFVSYCGFLSCELDRGRSITYTRADF
jgi:hypothetical protein